MKTKEQIIKDMVLLEFIDYCCKELQQIGEEINIAKNTDYDSLIEKKEEVSRLEGIVMTYMKLIKKINEMIDNNNEIQFSKN